MTLGDYAIGAVFLSGFVSGVLAVGLVLFLYALVKR